MAKARSGKLRKPAYNEKLYPKIGFHYELHELMSPDRWRLVKQFETAQEVMRADYKAMQTKKRSHRVVKITTITFYEVV